MENDKIELVLSPKCLKKSEEKLDVQEMMTCFEDAAYISNELMQGLDLTSVAVALFNKRVPDQVHQVN